MFFLCFDGQRRQLSDRRIDPRLVEAPDRRSTLTKECETVHVSNSYWDSPEQEPKTYQSFEEMSSKFTIQRLGSLRNENSV